MNILDTKQVVGHLDYLNTNKNFIPYYSEGNFVDKLPVDFKIKFSTFDNFMTFIETFKHVNIGYENKNSTKKYTVNEVKDAYLYFYMNKEQKLKFIDENPVTITPKHKQGDIKLTSNYRYLQKHTRVIKLIDRILLKIMLTVSRDNIDNKIFIAPIEYKFARSCGEYAAENTVSKERVTCLDIKDAFNSVGHDIIFSSLFKILNKTLNLTESKNLLDEYFLLLLNRKCYYDNTYIQINIGIPQGLSSSNYIFTVVMVSAIEEFKAKHRFYYLDININIYVDDIYIKFLRYENDNIILLNKLIHVLEDLYNLKLNRNKCTSDSKLGFEFPEIKDNTLYLGIPFTRDTKTYMKIILDEFNKKHYSVFNNTLTWKHIFLILYNKSFYYKKTLGFFKYKLKPIINYSNIIEIVLCNHLDYEQQV
jgi:hypothetical protein